MPEATPGFKQRLREAFEEMYVGQTFAFRRTFTDGDVAMFCGVTGDYSPYHQDADFARESFYGQLTVPGLLTGSMLTHIGGCSASSPRRCPSNSWHRSCREIRSPAL